MTRPRNQSELYRALRSFCRKQLVKSETGHSSGYHSWQWYTGWWVGYSTAAAEVLDELKRVRRVNTSRGRVDKTKKRRQVAKAKRGTT